MEATTIHGTVAVLCPPGGPKLGSEQDALALRGAGDEQDAGLIVVPVGRMAPEFFVPENGMLDAFVHRLTRAGRRVAFVGDLADRMAGSTALAAYVRRCNAGAAVLFVRTREELEARLA